MKMKKQHKGFAAADAPLFQSDQFCEYFESRVSMMVKNEIEQHFRDMLWNY